MSAKEVYEAAKNNYNNGQQALLAKGRIPRMLYTYGLIDAEVGRSWEQRVKCLPGRLLARLGLALPANMV